jgi:hypothetical protein
MCDWSLSISSVPLEISAVDDADLRQDEILKGRAEQTRDVA